MCTPSSALPRTVPVNRSGSYRDLSLLVLHLRHVAYAFACSVGVISLEGFVPRMGKISSYLPVDKVSAVLFLIGAAQRAHSVSDTAMGVSHRFW